MVDFVRSPNQSSRGDHHPSSIVIHYTGGGSVGALIRWLRRKEAKVSYHYVVGRSGDCYQLVQLDKAAWHAQGHNQKTIGIGLCNHGLLRESGDDTDPCYGVLGLPNGHKVSGLWEPYPDAQIDSLVCLIKLISRLHKITSVCAHSDLDPERKKDPGALFPWDRLPGSIPRGLSGG